MGDFPTDLVVSTTRQRPWPLPDVPWIMTQTWHDLLFAHWPVPVADIRARVPSVLDVDLFDDTAWLGVVPFRMTNVAPRFSPNIPLVSSFDELNVRTYVSSNGKPGVYFFSLDANSRLAVRVARMLFRLPYHTAAITVRHTGARIEYASRRTSADAGAALDVAYTPTGGVFEARPGTLDYFLTERYCLYTADRQSTAYRLEINHPPWPLQQAEAEISVNTMADAAGVCLPATRPVLHFSKRQDMIAWPLRRI